MSGSRKRWKQTLILILVFGGTGALLAANSRQSRTRPETQLTDPLADTFGLTPAQQSAVALVEVNGKGRCTGVLIGPRHVLTAKHCLRDAKEVSVQFANGHEASRTAVRVSKVDRHPRMDAALLWLPDAAPGYATPFHFSSEFDFDGLSGQGRALVGGFPRNEHGTTGARRFLSANVKEASEEISVEYPAEGLCRGDSGAPLLVLWPTGDIVMVGLLRGGAPNCRGPDQFIYGKAFAEWLAVASRASEKTP